ncbi:ubiquitin-like protein Pup [Bifidobacterium pullorum subsp. gallinarum]|uniref:Prokaryotic ubiquitin-like protein Pup n=1 Tax=Bifidobacterium pullorum subsp. gallinarum TaxID=78344 RepID=A0A4P6DZA5_9BIFI|nr:MULTISPECIES: ubiquitin-like protein Pup [Bifidobacterium]MBM6696828.1 ubiquitin-like protein Pup [Bifidobacterium pullorum subsp. saeculare]MBS5401436.1 ubiquitin-like protein Pup [Bifidobacterium sp.]QAY33288.1 ubiquitin-like protein Pup [Bifidobacterium pullorum subsp. gallinarum]HJG41193.1 ubiquitin-like protein Pup [Bifidobacterium pullorum subsp. gallinarum]
MPQEFAQQQEQAAQQPQEQAVAVDTSQTDGAVDALDAVLDDIESVLEQNAQEYVNSFVQKGGE